MTVFSLKQLLRIMVTILAIGLLGTYIWHERDLLVSAIQGLSPASFLGVSLTFFCQWILRAKSDQMTYRAAGFQVDSFHVFRYNNIQLALNYLPMKAGTVALALNLKKFHGISYRNFVSIFAAQNLISILVTSLLALACIPFVSTDTNWTFALPGILGGLIFISGILLFAGDKVAFLVKFFGEKIHLLAQGVAVFRSHSRTGLMVIAVNLVSYLLAAWRLEVLYQVAGVDASLLQVLIISSAVQISMLFAITPAGLGIREGLVGLMSMALIIPGSAGIITASLERLIVLMWVLIIYIFNRKFDPNSGTVHAESNSEL